MRLDAPVHWRLRVQNLLFLLLFGVVIGLLAWLSNRYVLQADWTAGGRNTLSEASRTLLARLDGPVRMTAYIRDDSPLRGSIHRLISRYQRYKPDMELALLNPDLLPSQMRELGITQEGELDLVYRGRHERLQQLSEQALTNALQRLSRQQERVVLSLDGHGERKLLGVANHDLGTFGHELEKVGIQVRPLTLDAEPRIPIDVAALVIAGPRLPLPPNEVQAVLEYVKQGGNLLWLLDPDDRSGLAALAATLGITILPGVVVDADAPRLGIKNPAFIPIADYGPHPVTVALRSPALLPEAVALDLQPRAGWETAVLLETQARTWTETGPLTGQLRFDPDTAERSGPLTVGVALFRPRPSGSADIGPLPTIPQQRLVIIGNGAFLSNTYLGNGANLELGLNILNWLTLDDSLIAIRPRTAPDLNLELSNSALALLAAIFLLVLPGLLLGSGWFIWFYRRRR
ncbi:MAG: GldG family protein [Candidatus Competibacteraceae bacterium]